MNREIKAEFLKEHINSSYLVIFLYSLELSYLFKKIYNSSGKFSNKIKINRLK